jgi:hypothetical protein
VLFIFSCTRLSRTPFVCLCGVEILRTAFRTADRSYIEREERGTTMREKLLTQLEYVQDRISDITAHKYIDIKQISDLQRYFEMQRNIIESLYKLEAKEGTR